MQNASELPAFSANRRVFVEITSLEPHGGPGWELGNCLWSPTKTTSGQDRYSLMREPKTDDLVLHFVGGTEASKSKALYGFSSIKNEFQVTTDRPPDPQNWEWSDEFYRIDLKDHNVLQKPVEITSFIDQYYTEIIEEFDESSDGLKAPKGHPLAKWKDSLRIPAGLYLRECTPTLYRVLSDSINGTQSHSSQPDLVENPYLTESPHRLFQASTKASTTNRSVSNGRTSSRRSVQIGKKGESLFHDYLKTPEGTQRFKVAKHLRDCSKENKGWDIEFENTDGDLIAVEVKSTVAASTKSITLTKNEWEQAEKLGPRYVIVIITRVDGIPHFEEVPNIASHPSLNREVSSWEIRLDE